MTDDFVEVIAAGNTQVRQHLAAASDDAALERMCALLILRNPDRLRQLAGNEAADALLTIAGRDARSTNPRNPMTRTCPFEGCGKKHTRAAHFRCLDCGMDTRDGVGGEIYLLHDELWKLHGPESGCLCIGCLEGRMGRRLCPSDFKDMPINTDNEYHSERLRDRLTGASVNNPGNPGPDPSGQPYTGE